MLSNYLKLSFRLMARNPFFTFINVIGLSVGFAVFFVLWQYSRSELRSDQFHNDFDRIARIGVNWHYTEDNGQTWNMNVSGSIAPEKTVRISQDFPEVESYLRIVNQPQFIEPLVGHESQVVLAYEKKDIAIKESNGCYADANLFGFFSIPLLAGKSEQVLKEENSIVLSERTSKKYFGNMNPVGELLVLNGTKPLKVTGVFKNLASNTHLNFDFAISNASWKKQWDSYIWFAGTHYIKLRKGTALQTLDEKIRAQSDSYWATNYMSLPHSRAEMFLQPLEDIAFSKDYYMDYFLPKSRPLLIVLSGGSILILAMAWINFVNITLTRMSKRMGELGARKVVGATTKDILSQFITESVIINLISITVAITLIQLCSKPIELFFHIRVLAWSEVSVPMLIFFGAIILLSVFFSAFPHAIIFRRTTHRALTSEYKFKAGWLPTTLTTFQYSITLAFILYVMIIAYQLEFILSKTIGNEKERIAVIESPIVRSPNFAYELNYFKNSLLLHEMVKGISAANTVPGDKLTTTNTIFVKRTENSTSMGYQSNGGIDENFIPLLKIRLIAGRNFNMDDKGNAIILSRVATQRLGYNEPEDAIGDKVRVDYSADWTWHEVEVIGVVEDYRNMPFVGFHSQGSEGICLTYKDYLFSKHTPERLLVKLDVASAESISKIEGVFSQIFPGNPFNFYYLDDHFNQHYASDKVSRDQIIFFTLIAIGIACLGLLGMISSKAVEKTKEIGIRKVLGAGLHQIATILLSTTARQMMIAAALGMPVATYLIQQYMQKFSERIEIRWWHFAIPVATLIVIMLCTVGSVVWKAAKSNPVQSLKCE